jgi:uncharacterized protein YjbI with pentapeptide repeats
MADPKHLAVLRQGVRVWNAWRDDNTSVRPDLSGEDLSSLNGADAPNSSTGETKSPSLGPSLWFCNFRDANLRGADLGGASLLWANFTGADLTRSNLAKAALGEAKFRKANLQSADLRRADLGRARFKGANLTNANLAHADLSQTDLRGTNLTGTGLVGAKLFKTKLAGATLAGCYVYGVSVWEATFDNQTIQKDLIITRRNEPKITVDNIEVAQFVYLLLNNEKIRDVLDTVGKKGVLLLGRFTEGRILVLERLREALRQRGYVPMVFNFEKPETKNFTETVRLLAGLSKFVIADLTSPKSAPYELGAIVPQTMIPFQPIIAEGETPFGMLPDLWISHPDRVFEPIYYSSVDALIASLNEKIIKPAEARFVELQRRKAEPMGGEHV